MSRSHFIRFTRPKLCLLSLFVVLGVETSRISAFIGNRLIEMDPSAFSQSLGGTSVSFNNQMQSVYSNPAHLENLKERVHLISYDQDNVENSLLRLSYGQYYKQWPVAVALSGLFPREFVELDDLGETLQSSNLYAIAFAINTARKFFWGGVPVAIGLGSKFMLENINGEKVFSPYLDFGLFSEFRLSQLLFFPLRSQNNFSLGMTAMNISYPRQVASVSQIPPLSFNLGLRWLMLQQNLVALSLMNEYRYFLNDNRFVEPQISLLVNFLSNLEIRAGFVRERQVFDFRTGLGFSYDIRGLYRFALNYAISPFAAVGVSQNVDLIFAITFANEREKIENQIVKKNTLEDALKLDVLLLMENVIKLYYLDHNSFPERLSDLESYVKEKYGFASIPQPSSGYWHYDKHAGKIKIVDAPVNTDDEQEFFLKDGGRIRGIITEEREDSFVVYVNGRKVNLLKSMIASNYSIRLRKLDMEVLVTLKLFLDEFLKSNGKFPADLPDFESFLKKKYSLNSMPKLLTGKLAYDALSGTLSLENF